MPNFIAIFITGLLTGGLSCLAVQGGLLAAVIAQRPKTYSITSFLIAKLVAYTILGALLGWLGTLFQLSLTVKIIMQFAVAIFMVGTALNLLHVHPIFRYFIIQPPRFLAHLLKNQSRSRDIFAPAILGAMTIFIPCGTTQAMMALAISSTNPLIGAAIMFIFILGTSPVFFTLGFIGEKFAKYAAIAILVLSVFTLDGALSLANSPVNLSTITRSVVCTISFCQGAVDTNTITFNPTGYSPNELNLKANTENILKLNNQKGAGCIQAFTIPKLNIQKIVTVGDTSEVTIPPQPSGTSLRFMCSMGMYQGKINFL